MDTPSPPSDCYKSFDTPSEDTVTHTQCYPGVKTYHTELCHMFVTPKLLPFCIGWETEILDAIEQATDARFASINIYYGPSRLSAAEKMITLSECREYFAYTRKEAPYMEDIMVNREHGELIINNSLEGVDMLLVVLDLLKAFHRDVAYNFFMRVF